jgi:hypothetical protein
VIDANTSTVQPVMQMNRARLVAFDGKAVAGAQKYDQML